MEYIEGWYSRRRPNGGPAAALRQLSPQLDDRSRNPQVALDRHDRPESAPRGQLFGLGSRRVADRHHKAWTMSTVSRSYRALRDPDHANGLRCRSSGSDFAQLRNLPDMTSVKIIFPLLQTAWGNSPSRAPSRSLASEHLRTLAVRDGSKNSSRMILPAPFVVMRRGRRCATPALAAGSW